MVPYFLQIFNFSFPPWTHLKRKKKKKKDLLHLPSYLALVLPASAGPITAPRRFLLGYSNHWELTVALAPWLDFTSSAGSPRPGSLGRNVWEKDSVNKYCRVETVTPQPEETPVLERESGERAENHFNHLFHWKKESYGSFVLDINIRNEFIFVTHKKTHCHVSDQSTNLS